MQLTIFCCCSPEPAPYRPNRRRLQAPPPTVRPSQHHQLPSPCVLPRFFCSFPRTCSGCAPQRLQQETCHPKETDDNRSQQQLHVHGRGMTNEEEQRRRGGGDLRVEGRTLRICNPGRVLRFCFILCGQRQFHCFRLFITAFQPCTIPCPTPPSGLVFKPKSGW